MTIVTTSEAQAMLPRLLASVAQGEEVFITDGGLPVARLIQPASPRPAPLAQIGTPETGSDEEDNDRPWRGIFAIEGPGEPYPDGQLHLSSEPQLPEAHPADILWDRVNATDDRALVSRHRRRTVALPGRPDSGLPRVGVEAPRSGDSVAACRSRRPPA